MKKRSIYFFNIRNQQVRCLVDIYESLFTSLYLPPAQGAGQQGAPLFLPEEAQQKISGWVHCVLIVRFGSFSQVESGSLQWAREDEGGAVHSIFSFCVLNTEIMCWCIQTKPVKKIKHHSANPSSMTSLMFWILTIFYSPKCEI